MYILNTVSAVLLEGTSLTLPAFIIHTYKFWLQNFKDLSGHVV